jgi:hypothetical protein
MDQRPKCKTENYRTIRRKQEKSFMTLDLAMISWVSHQKHTQQKKKIDKLNWIKVNTLYASMDTIHSKKQLTEWENMYLQILHLIRG